MKEKKRNRCVALVSIVVIAILCCWMFCFSDDMFVKRRIALYVGLVILVILVPILMIKISSLNQWFTYIMDRFCTLGHRVRQNKKKVLWGVGTALIGAFLVYPITYAICRISGTTMNNHRNLIALAIYAIIILCFVMRRIAYASADLLVFLAIMIMGTCAIFVTPRILGTAPDDEIHYRRTTEVIGFFTGSIYAADDRNLCEYDRNVLGHLYYDKASSGAYLKSLDDSYKKGEAYSYGITRLSYYHIAYIVPACGVMLGRALGTTYAYTFMMGKWFTCLCYALLVKAAMRRVRRGKAVFAAVGMIPAMVFLASSYNYDYWIMGWTLLGFAKYLALYENDEPITTRKLVDIFVTITIGILPKIVYFPLLFPL